MDILDLPVNLPVNLPTVSVKTAFYYALLDDSGVCNGLSQLNGEVVADNMIVVDDYDVALLGMAWDGVAFKAAVHAIRPEIVITSVSCNSQSAIITADFYEVTCGVGASVTLQASVKAGGNVVPISASFRMPIKSSDGREEVILISIVAGLIDKTIIFDKSGIWSIDQAAINASLPDAAKMAFNGIKFYVVR